MVVVKRLTVDSILCVVHPYLTDGGEFEQSEVDHRVVVALIAQMPKEHLPGSVLHLTLLIGREADTVLPVVIIVASHIVVTVITVDRHQRMAEHLAALDAALLHSVIDIGLEVVHHIHSTDKVVLVIGLKGGFKLGVADVSLISVVLIGVTVSHEGHHTFLSLSL